MRNQIDAVWNAFWAGGIANPLEVIEQITYLLFIRGLDDVQLREERKAAMLGGTLDRVIFPEGKDPRGRPYSDLRWSKYIARRPQRDVHGRRRACLSVPARDGGGRHVACRA